MPGYLSLIFIFGLYAVVGTIEYDKQIYGAFGEKPGFSRPFQDRTFSSRKEAGSEVRNVYKIVCTQSKIRRIAATNHKKKIR